MRCDSRKIHFHRRFELLQGWSRSTIRTRARCSSVVLACAGFHVQLSVTLPALIQPQSPNRTGCLVSFIKDAGLRGEVANVSSVGGIFSSYGKHSAEMPQRLMEALIVDGGTRLLKTAAACSGSIALYSSLPPSPVLPLHRSVSFLFKNSPEKNLPRSFHSIPPSWGTGGSPGALMSRRLGFIPAPRVAPAGGGGQMAPWHSPTPTTVLGLLAFESTQWSADFLRHSTQVHTRGIGP